MAPDTSSSFELHPDLICPYNNLGGSDGKESGPNVGDLGSIPGLGRFPGEGNGYCLENSMDRGVWRATVHGIAKGQT